MSRRQSAAVASAAVAAPPDPEQASELDDREAIELLLNQCRSAYEALDVSRVLRVFPTLPNVTDVERAFSEAAEVLIGFTPPEITFTSPTTATASCKRTQNFVPKVGRGRPDTRNITFDLRKDGGRWLINGVS